MQRNHATMMGPKMAPIPAVPRFCTQKRASRISTAMGTMTG